MRLAPGALPRTPLGGLQRAPDPQLVVSYLFRPDQSYIACYGPGVVVVMVDACRLPTLAVQTGLPVVHGSRGWPAEEIEDHPMVLGRREERGDQQERPTNVLQFEL